MAHDFNFVLISKYTHTHRRAHTLTNTNANANTNTNSIPSRERRKMNVTKNYSIHPNQIHRLNDFIDVRISAAPFHDYKNGSFYTERNQFSGICSGIGGSLTVDKLLKLPSVFSWLNLSNAIIVNVAYLWRTECHLLLWSRSIHLIYDTCFFCTCDFIYFTQYIYIVILRIASPCKRWIRPKCLYFKKKTRTIITCLCDEWQIIY